MKNTAAKILMPALGAFLMATLVNASPVSTKLVPASTQPRHYSNVDSRFYNSVITSWAGDNLVDRLETASKEAAEEHAKELASLGINAVIYSGRHFRLNYQSEWGKIKEYGKIVAEACHKYGIKIIEHHQFSNFYYSSYPMLLKHLDWLQRDIRTGAPNRWGCPNNPDFIKAWSDYLVDYQKATNVDGYMLDEISLASTMNCGCNHCRRKFKEATGMELPYWPDNSGFSSDIYRNWMRWRSRIAPSARGKLMDAVRALKPTAMNMAYCSDYSDSSVAGRGIDLTLYAAFHSSFLGWENMNAGALNSYRPFLRTLKLRLSYGNYYDIPVWSLNRETVSKEEVYFAWALCQAGKHSIWYGARGRKTPEELAYFKRYAAWPKVMPHRNARCLTKTGLMLSNQTRFTNPSRGYFWYDLIGWADSMVEGNFQFDTLLDGDLELDNRLGKYNTLILLGQASLSDKQCRNLAEWVKNGGTVIMTNQTMINDQYGKFRSNYALSKELGFDFKGTVSGYLKVDTKFNGEDVDYTTGRSFYVVKINDPKRVKPLIEGKTKKSGKTYPLALESKYGKGRFIYIVDSMGLKCFEMEFRNGVTYRGPGRADARNTIQTLLRYAQSGKNPAELKLPEGVKGTVYQLQGGKNNGDIYVHLLNVSGKSIKYGTVIKWGVPEKITYPPVKGNMEIILDAKDAGIAEIASPMSKEIYNIKPVPADNGKAKIVIPGKYLKAYLQVRVSAKPVEGQIVCPAPLASSITNSKRK
jgi:hypothetical protein